MPLKVAVIGAGPAGLATARYLKWAHLFFAIEPIQIRVFEAEDDIGGTFKYRVYEDAEVSLPLLNSTHCLFLTPRFPT